MDNYCITVPHRATHQIADGPRIADLDLTQFTEREQWLPVVVRVEGERPDGGRDAVKKRTEDGCEEVVIGGRPANELGEERGREVLAEEEGEEEEGRVARWRRQGHAAETSSCKVTQGVKQSVLRSGTFLKPN